MEEQSVEQLEEAVEKFLHLSRNEKEKMGENARTKMEKEFDRKKVVEEYTSRI